MRTLLHAGWTVSAVGDDVPAELRGVVVPATVPGCVHLDLLAAGLIPDPYLDENEAVVAWVGRTSWTYSTRFDWDVRGDGWSIDLVAEGLDTVAEVRLNDVVVAHTQNMHRTHRIPVAAALRRGSNDLTITFAAPVSAAEARSIELGPRPHVNAHPYNAIRKMACSYGWDWGPDLPTVGVWRSLALETWATARLAGVRPLVSVDGATGHLRVHVDIARAPDDKTPLTVRVAASGVSKSVSTERSALVVEIDVPEASVWWPTGYGEQPTYAVDVALLDGTDVLGTWEGRVGFREVDLDIAPDPHGTPFALHVNGIPVFVRGVNWIPDDCFPCRIDRARYLERLTQAKDAGVNLVRVWGGGIYESDDFYDVCDELGLLVWQDFLFACASYAEEEPLRGEVLAEAREAVTRLSPHPSLALWNGCNENIWGYWDWGWKEKLGGLTWGWGYYDELLRALVEDLDPTRPYSAGSPYSLSPDRHPNDPAHGTMHVWDVWNEVDYRGYRDYAPRFVAEFGFQGPPTWPTLVESIHDEPRRVDSAAMLVHQKAEDGNGKLARGLLKHLPTPLNFEDWHWATSLNQARAVAFGIEHFRSLSPRCMGAIMWQLNDCWPVTSWAAIDGGGRKKPLWYALRRTFADRLLTFQPRGDGLALIAVNDSSLPWQEVVQVSRRTFAGEILASTAVTVDLAPRLTGTYEVQSDVATEGDPRREVLLAQAMVGQTWWHFAEDRDADLASPAVDCVVSEIATGYRVNVTARTFLRDLALLAGRVAPDAEVDDMLVTLLPGQSVVFDVRTATALEASDLIDPLVLRCANQLVT